MCVWQMLTEHYVAFSISRLENSLITVLYLSVLHSAIELNKKYAKAFMKRARAYEKLGKKEECLQGN